MRRFDWGIGVRLPKQNLFRRAGLALLTVIGVLFASAYADPALANGKYAAIVIDGKTGEVLFSRKADYRRYPASLTKVMTLYMTFEALEDGKLKLTDKIPMSKRCAGMPPSDLRMKPGEKIPVEKAIQALIVRSANDVACAVGEKLGGTEYKFALLMTKKAKSIGMKRTRFRNASGLYHRSQVTTARDMATLALRIQKDFPQYYHYFKSLKVSWNGRTWNTHNRLMKYFPGADGLKTGYVRASGFNLITSARRGNMHLVGVVMGGRKSRSRDRHMVNILERNFARLLKRDDYSYPIADRLPELRPKPDFAAIESEKWLEKKVGVIPKPNPFQPDQSQPAEVAVAELQTSERQPISGGSDGTTQTATEAQAAAEPKEEATPPSRAQAQAARPAGTGEDADEDGNKDRRAQTALPVLAASGSGTLPAGGGTQAGTMPLEEENGAETAPAQTASSSTRLAAAAPQGGPALTEDAAAELIEEGDGQVATDDPGDELSARTEDKGDAAQGAVQLASAVPAASHIGAAIVAPSRQWGVQLGAFTTIELAEIHLDNAERLQPDVLTRRISALVPKDDGAGELYRARFGPMEEAQAKAVCEKLRAGGMHCFAIETDDWGEAVRR